MVKAARRLLSGLKHDESNFGREIVVDLCSDFIRRAEGTKLRILDLGCGHGTDLLNIGNLAGRDNCELYGVEDYEPNVVGARKNGITVFSLDAERETIPVTDGFFDVVVANQIIEHTKEVFWIFSEISRTLRSGGVCVVGTPNLASLHNRVLLLLGEQPSTIEVLGPHVRGFTVPSFRRFVEADGYFRVLEVRGCNFYPFPPASSKLLSRLFPTLSVVVFFLVQREARPGNFIQVLDTRFWQTSFFKG